MPKYYYWYKEHGICTNCGSKEAEPHKTLCLECLEKSREKSAERRKKLNKTDLNEYNRNLYRKRIESGVCGRCGRKVNPGEHTCIECRLKNARAKRAAYQRKKKNFGEGLCSKCDRKATHGKLCDFHYGISMKNFGSVRKPSKAHIWRIYAHADCIKLEQKYGKRDPEKTRG